MCDREKKTETEKNKNHIYLNKNIHTVYNEYGLHRTTK